jgi:hypothetical protein
MKFKNKTYDILKNIALIILPALATFYGSLGKIWDFPMTERVVLTITALDTFLGACLGISNINYKKESE